MVGEGWEKYLPKRRQHKQTGSRQNCSFRTFHNMISTESTNVIHIGILFVLTVVYKQCHDE